MLLKVVVHISGCISQCRGFKQLFYRNSLRWLVWHSAVLC